MNPDDIEGFRPDLFEISSHFNESPSVWTWSCLVTRPRYIQWQLSQPLRVVSCFSIRTFPRWGFRLNPIYFIVISFNPTSIESESSKYFFIKGKSLTWSTAGNELTIPNNSNFTFNYLFFSGYRFNRSIDRRSSRSIPISCWSTSNFVGRSLADFRSRQFGILDPSKVRCRL